jgi:fibronectin type 3 domain-containing protein
MKSLLRTISFLAFVALLGGCSLGTSGTTSGATPGAPTGVVVTQGIATLTLSWNAVAGATSYTVYDTVDGSIPTTSNFHKSFSTTDPTLTITITSTTLLGTAYAFVVSASNDNGEGRLSSVETGATLFPTNVQAITTSSGAMTITWDAVSGAASYNVYDTKDGSMPTTMVYNATYSKTTTTLHLINCSSGDLYTFAVTAVDSNDYEGALSSVAQVTCD